MIQPLKLAGSTIRETISALFPSDLAILEVEGNSILYKEMRKRARRITPREDDEESQAHEPPDLSLSSRSQEARASVITSQKELASTLKENRQKAIMRIVITILLLAFAIVLEFRQTDNSKTLPGVIIGAIIGYWLK